MNLFLNDEIAEATLLLQDAAPAEDTVRKPVAVAGCNCDRWGHPCPTCLGEKTSTGGGAWNRVATEK